MVSWISISGCDFRNVRIAGNNIVFAACSTVVIRIVPDGRFCRSLRDVRAESMSCNIGPRTDKRCSPASVGTTLRVVRVRSRNPNRSSIRRTIWLKADCAMLRRAAARVKLRSSATTTNAIRSAISSRFIQYLHTIY